MHITGAAYWSYSSLRQKPVTTGPLQHQAELLQHRSFSIEINKLSLYRCWPWYLVPHFCVKFCFIVGIHLTVHACTIFITIINFLKSQGWTSCGCTADDPSVGVDQLQGAGNWILAEQDLRRVCYLGIDRNIWTLLIQSYNMLLIKILTCVELT